MIILCDTSCVLMLLRISPDMFHDERYGCVTIKEVHDELFGTQKFKSKYPWRIDYKDKIKPLSASQMDNDEVAEFLSVISALNTSGTVNRKTGRLFDLSYTDKKILAGALVHGYKITSGDQDLIMFAKQEFAKTFKGEISPLEIINMWLEKKLFAWDSVKQEYLAEWNKLEEHPQTKRAMGRFQKLTGKIYPGS